MTPERHAAYRRVILTATACQDPELHDIAEGLLLFREPATESLELLHCRGALALSRLVGTGRLSDGRAEIIWRHLKSCGPGLGASPVAGVGPAAEMEGSGLAAPS